jgi:hypothetical protein
VGPPDVRYFLITLWIIPGCMGQPLNHWARTTGRTPLAGRPPLFGPINRTLPPRIFHSFRTPLGCQFVSKVFSKLVSVGECVCVCKEFASSEHS